MNKIYKNTTLCLLIIFLLAIFTKIFQYNFLPIKYFYDSKHILSLMNGNYIADKTYNTTAMIFDKINIFQFYSLEQWSIILGIIFNLILFLVLLKRQKVYNNSQYIFIYASTILLNIYVFNLSKDIIQFFVFLLIYIVLVNTKMKNNSKLILILIILIIEAFTYRMYYGIMAILLFTIYVIYNCLIKDKQINKKKIVKVIIISLIAFFIEIFIISIISTENYNSIIYARSSANINREESLDAVTIIKDYLGLNTNFLKFIGNYLINFVRMAIPVELVLNGIKYIPFIIYQIYVTYVFISKLKKTNKSNILVIATVLSYFMISVIFEPDFGSFIRHESAMFLILMEMTKNEI